MLELFSKLLKFNFIFLFVFILFIFYLIGSIPFGLIIGKVFKNKDLRLLGSKNIGASNAARVLGFKYGLFIFILDFAKGFFAVSCSSYLMIKILDIYNFSHNINKEDIRIYFGLITILGQIFSIFNKFKGGKAISTSVGVVCGLNPFIGFLGILSFIIFLRIFGYAFFASLISTLLVNFFMWIFFYFDYMPSYPIYFNEVLILFLITIFIFYKHFPNIINWKKGKENKFLFN
ncbi:glycerol-3-phosphate 1-O-acyltransferase PlsY [Candidatus Phytoplasma oryzae]|nr:glycerol-3-phosphate 1-O-acyltransferase PlsY [Candidatus Phytoplasma oryzae]